MAHRRQSNGLEAPRNSLDSSMEASQSCDGIHYDIPVKQPSSKKCNFYHNGAPVKMLLNEEMSNRTKTKRSTPSVVARLMGMDTLPSEIKPTIHAKERKDEKCLRGKEPTDSCATIYSSLTSITFKQRKQEMLLYDNNQDSSQPTESLRLARSQRRQRPQEELLQKFKKEFEAWKASKVWELSRTIEPNNNFRQRKDNRILEHENLSKGKMARYSDTARISAKKKLTEPKNYTSTNKLKINTQGGALQHEGYVSKLCQYSLKEGIASRNNLKTDNLKHLPIAKFDKRQDRSSPTSIVILKHGFERIDDIEESGVGRSESLEKEGSMEDFLEEVRERLRFEMQRKARNDSSGRGSETQTYLSGMSTDPKQLARDIAKHIRESVIRDLGTAFMPSESTRSYRREVQFSRQDFPESIKRDTGKLLVERLKNVEKPMINNRRLGASLFIKGKMSSKSMSDFPKIGNKVSYGDDKKAVAGSIPRYCRHEQEISMAFDAEAMLPRNLVRSFSAPVSRTGCGKLFLDDHHVAKRAQIGQKNETSEHMSAKVSTKRKDGFNLKGRVSNLRRNLTLKGMLFGKKIQSVQESAGNKFDSMKAFTTAPSVVMNFGIVQDNSTEVPPSPVSMSSSSFDEFCRPGHPSPVSPLEIPLSEDHSSMQVSGELSTNLPELRSLLEQVENCCSEKVATQVQAYEDETAEIEGLAEAYLRDILITSGLYNGISFDQAIARWEALSEPIPHWVFDEVEESYSKFEKVDSGVSILCLADTHVGRKMLFDLINEALPSLVGTPMTSLTFKRWVLGPTTMHCGKKLLDGLWHQIQMYTNTKVDESQSIDKMVAQDVKRTPLSTTSHEVIGLAVREVEWVILRELIDEFVCDM